MMVRDCCLVGALKHIREDQRELSRILWGQSPTAASAEQGRDALNPLGEHIAQATGMTKAFADMHDGTFWSRKDLPKGRLMCAKCRKEDPSDAS